MDRQLLSSLRCPDCRGLLALEENSKKEKCLICELCRCNWPIAGDMGGMPMMYRERQVRPKDRLLRLFYDGLPALHDPATRYLLPLMDWGCSESLARRRFMARLELNASRSRAESRPLRVLEVGIGTGVNIPFIEEALGDAGSFFEAEIWGLDLSRGMLNECRKNTKHSRFPIHLVLGDAHALPFPDACFDRVFHVGAMNSFGDPRRALAEMARVAKPGSPIVIVDEQLDRSGRPSLWTKICFRMLTFYDRNPHCPVELLPGGAYDILTEQITRFFYCMRFRAGPTVQ